ncbi:hypothetical protein CRG98_035836 [Punica granatum]|uniref:Uncharacterized protein n=1 Tax=Punica granatum TaxID=22663 RepID=A0A2I0IJ46_PUNGR|nr:hypothetical protein CRG98_035836 [Punica granatum]
MDVPRRFTGRHLLPLKRPSGNPVHFRKVVRSLFHDPDSPWVRVGPFWGAVHLLVDRAPGALSEKASVRYWGTPRPKQDTSEARPDVSLVTLALRWIFGVPYWAPFGASVTR